MYIYYNANPEHKIIGDCVVRAMTLALHKNYNAVINMLVENSKYFNCDIIVKDCYKNLLLSYEMIKPYNKTVEEISEQYKNNILLIRIDQHLTCSMYGDIYDIWDTSKEIVDVFWIIR